MKLLLFANSNNSLKSWIRLELQEQVCHVDVKWEILPGKGLPSFCSSMSPAVAQGGDSSISLEKHLHMQESSGPAHGQQSCNSDQFSSLSSFLVFPSALVAWKWQHLWALNMIVVRFICLKENWKSYLKTAFLESIMGYKVNNQFSLQWLF